MLSDSSIPNPRLAKQMLESHLLRRSPSGRLADMSLMQLIEATLASIDDGDSALLQALDVLAFCASRSIDSECKQVGSCTQCSCTLLTRAFTTNY